MTADQLLSPVAVQIAGFIAWFAVPLIGFTMLSLIGRR